MFFARTLRKWWFKGGTKLKRDESQSEDMEAYHDEVPTSSGIQRPKRYRKLFASFGCALLGIVLFILFTFGQKIDISLRAKRPKFVQHPPMRMFYEPRLMIPDRFPNATTNQQPPFLLAGNSQHFPKKKKMDPEQQEIARFRKSKTHVAEKSKIMEGRPPNRHIPGLERHPRVSDMRTSTQEFDDHDEVNR